VALTRGKEGAPGQAVAPLRSYLTRNSRDRETTNALICHRRRRSIGCDQAIDVARHEVFAEPPWPDLDLR